MFRTKRTVSKLEAGASQRFGLQWLMPILVIGIVGGCETAGPLVDPVASEQQQPKPTVELGEYASVPNSEAPRTTVVCTATGTGGDSSLTHGPKMSNIVNGTFPVCPPPPCGIEPSVGIKGNEATIYFAFNPSYYSDVLNETMLTITGVSKGWTASDSSSKMLTKTFGPLPPISLSDVDHTVAITIDSSEFADIASASLSWVPNKQNVVYGVVRCSPSNPCYCP